MTHTTDNQPKASERSTVTAPKKKLIEVSLPLEAINAAGGREKSIRHGHPSTLHLWWARRPLATARAVLFSQLVDDPSSRPEEFPTRDEQDAERARLHDLIAKLVVWENSNNEELLSAAKEEIRRSNNGNLPAVLDPFAGGGTIPLEAQRLGLPSNASDLNPVAVLINRALVDFPSRFADRSPVHPEADVQLTDWSRGRGLAEDVRKYGVWLRDEAERRVGSHYPCAIGPDGEPRTVIAWLWARTVTNPNPANPVEVPLVPSWQICSKKGKEVYVRPTVVDGEVRFEVNRGPLPDDMKGFGTVDRSGAESVADGTPISFEYIRGEGRAGRIGARLIATIVEDARGRLYLSPTAEAEAAADVERPLEGPSEALPDAALGFRVQNYGLTEWGDLFTNRQLLAINAMTDLLPELRLMVERDALAAGFDSAGVGLDAGGSGSKAYADAVSVYLSLAISRLTARSSNLSIWHPGRETVEHVFLRPAMSMTWSYPEANPFSSSSGSFLGQVDWVSRALERVPAGPPAMSVTQADASTRSYESVVVSTDPPYYDNIGYSDLSDFYYVWLRRMLSGILPGSFATLLTPKQEELVANPFRHGGQQGAERFFIDGFNQVFSAIRTTASSDCPIAVYYAYRQSETNKDGTSSTGWHTLLGGSSGAVGR